MRQGLGVLRGAVTTLGFGEVRPLGPEGEGAGADRVVNPYRLSGRRMAYPALRPAGALEGMLGGGAGGKGCRQWRRRVRRSRSLRAG